jgi:hypothetical protein
MKIGASMDGFTRAVTDRLRGVKRQLPETPTLRVNANLDTGKVVFELQQATGGLILPLELAERLSKSFDKAGMAVLARARLRVLTVPPGVDHLPMKVDVTQQRKVQLEFKEHTSAIEMEASEAIQVAEVIRRAVRFITKLERKGRTMP